MSKIIFLILPILVYNFYKIDLKLSYYIREDAYFFKLSKNEYNIIYSGYPKDKPECHLMKVETDSDIIINDEIIFDNIIFNFKRLENNINIYIFSSLLIVENNGNRAQVKFDDNHYHYESVFGSNSILIGFRVEYFEIFGQHYNIDLYLLKDPYTAISKTLIIESIEISKNFKLIGLKDYFILIIIDNLEYTYKILDVNLNIINSITVSYTEYVNVEYSDLTENKKINEFIMCYKYFRSNTRDSIMECKIVKCENSNLLFSEPYQIFKNDYSFYQTYLILKTFDEDKIGCYLLQSYNEYGYLTILQYENKNLFYYNNIKEIQIPNAKTNQILFIKTYKGLGMISYSYNITLFYLSSICVSKTIYLSQNLIRKFPINEFIFPGFEQLEFSFIEIDENLIIYKNSKKIKIGQIFSDLNDFTYLLNVKTNFKFFNPIKIKNHIYDYICIINIDITADTNIKIDKETHICVKDKNYNKINNILYSNLYRNFEINYTSTDIQFEFTMEDEPKGNELIFFFNDITLNCVSNYKNVICKAPLNIFPIYEKLYLYSYLSCYNLINVGWFQINDLNIFRKYDLINYNFDEISKIYDPSKKIKEYSPEMINYYYWFSCLSYCDDEKIEQKNCCNNILNKWKIVFHKEYIYDEKHLKNLVFDTISEALKKNIQYLDFGGDYMGLLLDLYKESPMNEGIGKIVKGTKNKIDDNSILISLIQFFVGHFLYRYNFVILKNDEYKKIVVSFPGITSYFQIIQELFQGGMVRLPIKSEDNFFNVLEMYYNIFTKIETDLFDNLASLSGINNEEYQIIFTGHSLGGAIATISSFYYIKKYNFIAENILITFGQPKVGSEFFARELTDNLRQIYRIARPNDIATLFPMTGIDVIYKAFKIFSRLIGLGGEIVLCGFKDCKFLIKTLLNFLINFKDIDDEYYLTKIRPLQDTYYSHIGGLYMIIDDNNKVYHCDNFFNEKRDHPICKNHKMKLSFLKDFFRNRNYLSTDQDMISSCQKKKLKMFRYSTTTFNRKLRRLQIIYNINIAYKYNIQRNRILDNIINLQETLYLFKEINFKKNNFEFCYKYESNEILNIDNLLLIINPQNTHIFGEICFFQNISWLINKELDLMNCYFINVNYPFSLKIELEKEIINEKELYIYIEGKVSGTLELYDLTKNKTLNILSSYYIPYIYNYSSENNLNFRLPKIGENIYINIIINDYGNSENKNISSIFEIYKEQNKINYTNNYLILEKGNEYYFKYFPGQYELIINFTPIYNNKFLEKQFYIINDQKMSINYNIKSKNNNQIFGLFFDFNENINTKGYFSNTTQIQDNFEDYILNTDDKYFILEKNDEFIYFNLEINLNSELVKELKISEIDEVIIINKINYSYEINKIKNYMFLLDKTIQNNFTKFESYILISINNDNNILKLITSNNDIISSKNYLLTKIYDIKGIFIKVNENDIFMIKIIPQEVSKYIIEESGTYFGNSFIEDKKYTIDFINSEVEIYTFYNALSNNLKIYEIKFGSNFELEDISNNNTNYSSLLGLKTLEEQKTHMILKESSGPFLYQKYIEKLFLDLNYILDISKICYLFLDFEYTFSLNKRIQKILLNVLNNENEKTSIIFKCGNEIIEIKNNTKIINVEKCNGTFIISGYNSLIYFYLPLTLNDSYKVVENEENFELLNINQFFFVPKKNDFNSINILLTLDNISDNNPIFITYYIEYGVIPYSSNIEKRQILIYNETNINIPNYSNYSKENEKYYIFFKFNSTISKLNSKIIYENIIYLDDQTYLILKPGINIIKFNRDNDYYLNITKFKKSKDNSFYSIYKDEKIIEKHEISNTENIIYIEEPSYNENIKLKIENEDDILLYISSEKFKDFSYISYNKKLAIEQIENNLIIKFNTTNYISKLEYYIAIIEKEDNIDPNIMHKKFFENDLLYKNIIYSTGKEQIETSFSLKNNFIYNKNYSIIAYGKEDYGDSFNYFYLEPETLLIYNPNNTFIEDNKYNTVNINTNIIELNDSNSDIAIEPNITTIDEFSDKINGPIGKNENKNEDKLTTIIIIIIIVGSAIIVGGISICLIFYTKNIRYNIIEDEKK